MDNVKSCNMGMKYFGKTKLNNLQGLTVFLEMNIKSERFAGSDSFFYCKYQSIKINNLQDRTAESLARLRRTSPTAQPRWRV